MIEYKVIGLMSGTSLDGVDIAFCRFMLESGNWDYQILHAETIPYPEDWFLRLSGLAGSTAADYVAADHGYGHFLGRMTREFIEKYGIKPDFIASHGHTVFHQPSKGFTAQIGSGAAIKAETGLPVICDFRSGDVANKGQGAPLVPAGDKSLFSGFDYCLNLGGFANISFDHKGSRIAYDICPVNIVLNSLARKSGKPCDHNGTMAAAGHVDKNLLDALNDLPFYKQSGPKSLGKEWVDEIMIPLLDNSEASNEDNLSTFSHHIAQQIAVHTGTDNHKKVLVTGGGTFNKYLVSLIRAAIKPQLIIPDTLTINFKEALIFAFLGVLRSRNEINCLSSVTGALQDGSCGAQY